MKKVQITIDNFLGGFAPAWFNSEYPSYGNRNMAGDMVNIDLTDPACLKQGPGLLSIDPNSTIDTLINSILDFAVSTGKTYGIGEEKFYELTSVSAGTASTPALPHTITGTTVSGEDVALYEGKVYYSYNTNVSANVGRYNTLRAAETDFDDDWATVSASAHICAGVPLPLCAGGDSVLYIGNANRVSSFDDTTDTYTDAEVDLPADSEIQDLAWNEDRLFIAANRVATQGFYLGQLHTAGDLYLIGATYYHTEWTNTDYMMAKRISLSVGGSYRFSWSAQRTTGGDSYVQLRKNYVPSGATGDVLGTWNWSSTDQYTVTNIDYDDFVAGDTISMMIKMPSSCTGHALYLKVYVGEYYVSEPPAIELDDI